MELAASSSSAPSPSPSMEDLMKLLRGKTDSQRLAGLLLVTKFCDRNDQQMIVDVYKTVGSNFLHRLLLTGMGKGNGGVDNANRDAYLRLSVTVLSVFARVPEIAATEDMLARVPLFLELMSKEYDPSIAEECYEFLFLVSTAHEDGVVTLCESGGISYLASQMLALPDGSHTMELAMKLVQLIISKQPAEKLFTNHPPELSKIVIPHVPISLHCFPWLTLSSINMFLSRYSISSLVFQVAAIAKQFAVLHNSLKFEALHLLTGILSSNYSGSLRAVLRSMIHDEWSMNIRVGVMDVLQNRVAPAEKIQALVLAECVIAIVGEKWLVGPMTVHSGKDSVPADRCILLVLESSRVEIAVILNELAYLKYEASQSSPNAENFLLKLRDLGVAISLVERVIKLIAEGEDEGSNLTSMINESTLTKIISGLNETIGVVLDYLQDAKEHAQSKGDDLLASVRIVGSYLAEAPHACQEKVKELLAYMLSVQGEDEPSPFCSTCFLLPMLCQLTMRTDGCKKFASTGAFGAVVECLVSLLDSSSSKKDDGSTIFLACDTLLNFLLKREEIHFSLEDPSAVKLLQALLRWTADKSEQSVLMMASSICSLIADSTSEEALLRHPDFCTDDLIVLSKLIKKSLGCYPQDLMSDDASSTADLQQIVASGYSSWADRFPHIREAVER